MSNIPRIEIKERIRQLDLDELDIEEMRSIVKLHDDSPNRIWTQCDFVYGRYDGDRDEYQLWLYETRPETDTEYAKRCAQIEKDNAKAKKEAEKAKATKEERDRKEFARLQKKYGKEPAVVPHHTHKEQRYGPNYIGQESPMFKKWKNSRKTEEDK